MVRKENGDVVEADETGSKDDVGAGSRDDLNIQNEDTGRGGIFNSLFSDVVEDPVPYASDEVGGIKPSNLSVVASNAQDYSEGKHGV